MVVIQNRWPLPVQQPFDAPGVHAFLAARSLPGVETAPKGTKRTLRYARSVRLPSGPGAISLRFEQLGRRRYPHWNVYADLELSDPDDALPALALIRSLLDLDADLHAVDRAMLLPTGRLHWVHLANRGIRLPGCIDAHELVVRAIVGQQISVPAATTHLCRLVKATGTPYRSSFEGITALFPTAGQVAEAVTVPAGGEPLDARRPLRLPRRSLATVHDTATALADGTLIVSPGTDPATLRSALVARLGIGPWTAAYLAMRVCHDQDAWLTGDVALVAGARSIGLLPTDLTTPEAHRELARLAQAWSPARSYAAMHLWQAAARISVAKPTG